MWGGFTVVDSKLYCGSARANRNANSNNLQNHCGCNLLSPMEDVKIRGIHHSPDYLCIPSLKSALEQLNFRGSVTLLVI